VGGERENDKGQVRVGVRERERENDKGQLEGERENDKGQVEGGERERPRSGRKDAGSESTAQQRRRTLTKICGHRSMCLVTLLLNFLFHYAVSVCNSHVRLETNIRSQGLNCVTDNVRDPP
jgi:hypothetical protein